MVDGGGLDLLALDGNRVGTFVGAGDLPVGEEHPLAGLRGEAPRREVL